MTAPTIDRSVFAQLEQTTGDAFAKELVDTFLEEAPTMLSELRHALAAKDADKFRRAAHSLKSNSNTFGALALAAMSRELELAGLPRALEDGAQRLDALDEEYSRVAAALTELRDA